MGFLVIAGDVSLLACDMKGYSELKGGLQLSDINIPSSGINPDKLIPVQDETSCAQSKDRSIDAIRTDELY